MDILLKLAIIDDTEIIPHLKKKIYLRENRAAILI